MNESIAQLIGAIIGIAPEKVAECNDFVTELAINSLQRMQILDEIEDTYDVTINVKKHMPRMRNVADISKLVEELKD